MPQLENLRLKGLRAVDEHLSSRKITRSGKRPRLTHILHISARNPFNPQPLIYHLTNRRQVGYSSVKVLLTVSPVRPSFLQPPALHPANHRFFTPLFSTSSESLFSQLLCFHIYLNPYRFFPRIKISRAYFLAARHSPFSNSFAVSTLRPLCFSCLSFSHSSCLFSMACGLPAGLWAGLFSKIPGVWVSRTVLRDTRVGVSPLQPRRAHPREKQRETLGRTTNVCTLALLLSVYQNLQVWLCALRGSVAIQPRNATWTRLAHPTIIAGERSAAGSRSQVYG